jgi:3-oxoadipate enol-lactonase
MAFAELGDVRIRYELEGEAEEPVVLLSNSLGTDLTLWDPQAAAWRRRFRLLRYDTRGHGRSSVTPGPYTIEQLGRDVLDLLDFLKLRRVHFCGLSMGGQTGMWLGLHAPERLGNLVLCNTAAKIGTPESWATRIATVRKGGMKAVSSGVMERWFSAEFRTQEPEIVGRVQRLLELTEPEGYIANCEAVRDFDCRANLADIHLPTLVIAGSLDNSTPPSEARFLSSNIPRAGYAELKAAHLSNIEDQARFTTTVGDFMADGEG